MQLISGASAAIFVLIVALLNLVPVAYELILSALQRCGLRPNTKRLNYFTRLAVNVGNFGEYGLMVVVLCLIFGAIYLHVDTYYPFYQVVEDGQYPLVFTLLWHVGPSLWLNSNMLFNFYKGNASEKHLLTITAVRMSPGVPATSAATKAVHGMRMCKYCRKPKPPRAHHCSSCGVCVLRMDHHCPFAVNCMCFIILLYFYVCIKVNNVIFMFRILIIYMQCRYWTK